MFDSPPPGRRGRAICGVLTIVPEELDAAQKLLGATTPLRRSPYVVADALADGMFPIVIRQTADRTNAAAGEAAHDMMEDFRPPVIFLVGIAGGVKGRDGTQLGDVVVADFIDYYEFRKLSDGKSMPRRIAYDHPSLWLRQNITQPLCGLDSQWAEPILASRPGPGRPVARVGNILAGEKLFGDASSSYQAEILREYDKALAVDMESYGFARAIFKGRWSAHYNPQCAVVRGISDFAQSEKLAPKPDGGVQQGKSIGAGDCEVDDNEGTRRKWRQHASEAAVAFTAAAIKILLEE